MAGKKKQSGYDHGVGDYVVYPIHGVGEITEIAKKVILGKKKECYVMEIQGSKMKVMIPVDKAKQVGIRPIIDKKDIKKVINLLKKDEVDTEEDWKIRYQNNLNKIKSGSIFEVADVCRNLFRRANGKELSIMERKLYESAYNLVKMEVALSKGVSQEEAGNLVSDVLASTFAPGERVPVAAVDIDEE
ncbi:MULTISPECIES: CarD family transcriptional regulator [Leptospira]|uniref:Transcriptional regulator n=4 Tax=Leptospira TaxID=171 RepID=A0A4R9G8G8_9LEPT|nr:MULTISPECIES: CarD family transcriptional regulator [Leptospira]EIE02672.1 CarD-like protein [Leptospira licerasiae serovar Varillal str. VAR 010]EJZ40147.1 CarD-like protein [Leptospira licerasiae str. MMD4847]MCR1793005.1 transcriptional regulator [Leptospira sp. id769339]TGK07340.1 transcriptional regulator [Leptospira semungkisensis]TGL63221.1 transcriptional regulator [Leptospira sarikeiensis]